MAYRKTRIIAIVGSKKSGKTTVAEFLVRRLARSGYGVSAIKHVHHRGFTLDTRNKDSWRLTRAGAGSVVVTAPGEIAEITRLSAMPMRKRFGLAVRAALQSNPDLLWSKAS